MAPQAEQLSAEAGVEMPGGEASRLSFLSLDIGGSVMNAAMRVAALGGITASLFVAGPLTGEAGGAEGPAAPAMALTARPHQPPKADHQAAATHIGETGVKCTWIMDFPKGYYFGEACSNDKLIKLGESNPRGFSYAMLIVDGVYKCGWVQDGVVPVDHGKHKSVRYCKEAYKSLTFNAHAVLKDLNCDPGDCTDGTPTKETPYCKPEAFANFSTATRSVLNVYPNGKSGFVEPVGIQPGKINYRATIAESSQVGFAAVVRGNKGWDLMPQACVPTPLLISTHSTNNSPSIKLGSTLSAGEPAVNNLLATTPTPS